MLAAFFVGKYTALDFSTQPLRQQFVAKESCGDMLCTERRRMLTRQLPEDVSLAFHEIWPFSFWLGTQSALLQACAGIHVWFLELWQQWPWRVCKLFHGFPSSASVEANQNTPQTYLKTSPL